jgi:phage-related minor tail protein
MTSSRIKGITIEIDGDTTKLGKALESAESSSKKLQGELKGINTLLKLDPSNVELLTQKQKVLTDSISATEDKLNTLKRAQAQVQEQFDRGEITAEQFRDFQREIIVTEQRLKALKDEMKEFGSVSEQQLKATGKKVEELGTKIEDTGKKFSGISAAAGAGLGVAITSAASLEEAVHKYLGATGKSIEETQKYQEVLQSIHNNNYGENYVYIAHKMRIVSNILGDLPQDELQSVVEKSYLLEDAYGMDFQENVRGVNALMDQFGITADQAYELINQGAQKGLNQNQDLTDQIAEYSTYYSKLGFTAEEFFNIMIAGSKDGAYQIDYLNDAMKEFGIRTKDNSTGTISAFEAMGMNEQDIMNKFAQGEDTAQEVFAEVTSSLMALEDPVIEFKEDNGEEIIMPNQNKKNVLLWLASIIVKFINKIFKRN